MVPLFVSAIVVAYKGQLGVGISTLLLPLSSFRTDTATSLSMLPFAHTLPTLIPGKPPSREHRTTDPSVEKTFPELEQFLVLCRAHTTLRTTLLGVEKPKGVGPLTPSPSTPALVSLTLSVPLRIGFCTLQ